MPESISGELKIFRQKLEDFLSESSSIGADTLRSRSLESGYFKMAQPSEGGETEAGPLQLAIARETVAAAGFLNVEDVIGPEPGILNGAGEYIEKNFLSPMLCGAKVGCFAYTESDASNPTIAEWEGDLLVIQGKKSYVSGAHNSDFISVVLTVNSNNQSSPAGRAVVIVDTSSPGILVGEPFYSIDGSGHCEVTFERTRVHCRNIIGGVGQGIPRALMNIERERLELAATATGMSAYAANLTNERLKSPHRFGGSLGDFEGVRLRYGEMRIQTFAARSVLYRAARMMESGSDSLNEVSAAKVFCTETASIVVDWAIQLCGGSALVVGHPLESMYRKIRSMRLAGGASDIVRLGVSRGIMEFDSGVL